MHKEKKQKQLIDINELFSKAWGIYKENWLSFILIGIIFMIAGSLGNSHGVYLNMKHGDFSIPAGMIFYKILGHLVMAYLEIGYIRFLFKLLKGEKARVQDIFYGVDSFGHFAYVVLVNILVGVITGFGLILFIVPGVIAALGLMFAKYIIIENKGGDIEVVDALKKSLGMTKGHKLRLLWLYIVLGTINILGAIPLFLGLIITIPLSALIFADTYLRFLKK